MTTVLRGPGNTAPYRYNFELGTDLEDMTNVEEQAAIQEPPYPHEIKSGAERYTSGTGNEYYDGYPQLTWHWSFMPVPSWQWLIDTFFGDPATALSVDVYVRTKNQNDDYAYYSAKMHMPEIGSEAHRGILGYYDITLRFTHMILQT